MWGFVVVVEVAFWAVGGAKGRKAAGIMLFDGAVASSTVEVAQWSVVIIECTVVAVEWRLKAAASVFGNERLMLRIEAWNAMFVFFVEVIALERARRKG